MRIFARTFFPNNHFFVVCWWFRFVLFLFCRRCSLFGLVGEVCSLFFGFVSFFPFLSFSFLFFFNQPVFIHPTFFFFLFSCFPMVFAKVDNGPRAKERGMVPFFYRKYATTCAFEYIERSPPPPPMPSHPHPHPRTQPHTQRPHGCGVKHGSYARRLLDLHRSQTCCRRPPNYFVAVT